MQFWGMMQTFPVDISRLNQCPQVLLGLWGCGWCHYWRRMYVLRKIAALYCHADCEVVESPAQKWPGVIEKYPLLIKYPYLLPCALAASITFTGLRSAPASPYPELMVK
jgi:hypothetical protein